MADPRINEIKTLLPQGMLPDWVRLGSRLVRLLRDRLHPDKHEPLLQRLLDQARASVLLRQSRLERLPQISYPGELPITSRKDDIVQAIRQNQVVVLAGETGSGKTTQIPKMCLEAGLGIEAKIGCTQPRRVAALSISRRIAEELNVQWGREVGCKIRFDDRSSPDTYIKLMTDGILLAETQADPLLCEYNAIIIDEAHERSLNIDFLIGYLKSLLVKRHDLKLIITSATIDTEAFSAAFNNAPIIEVSGRMYPVDVVYAPPTAAGEDAAEISHIDAAVAAVETILCEPGSGDVLIFMPGERDIRETSDLIEGRFSNDAEVVPLYGRLGAGDQQRVFAPSFRRKIVVATNIAETSLTIPGIRYVIDAGLARISRYNPRTRTKRLPVEPISQSSANQRKGRAGRVRDGICIRLYSEEDFAGRPAFTQPEIQRANLAEVILRMKAYHLGEIETFQFINPPTPAAIQNGYVLLQELGALNEKRELTPLGLDLARLPIDPTLGRMLLQSQHEHAPRELLIIASGLSIQDPRERPADQKEAANAAHRRFLDPRSDFLTLLNIWNTVQEQWDILKTQGQRRRFCRTHFLSYLRIREWQDLHGQLHGVLENLGSLKINESNASYEAIHRSILVGLIGHVANRTERNAYKASGNRQLTVFPGSVLYDRQEKTRKPAAEAPPKPGVKTAGGHQPPWIVAGEIVETSQLFARTVAGVDPMWIVQLASHLCKFTHQNPHWSPTSGRVLATERVTLYGLEIHNRKVAYGPINQVDANRIFIRSALVEEQLFAEPGKPQGRQAAALSRERSEDENRKYRRNPQFSLVEAGREAREEDRAPGRLAFLDHNRRIRQKIETWQTRVRRHDLRNVDDALFEFYLSRLPHISSLHELNRVLGENKDPHFLQVTEAELAGGNDLQYDASAFPDSVTISGQPVPLEYAYAPGEDHDGVTVKLGLETAMAASASSIDWSIPGLREEQIAELLRALPKSLRRDLMPLPPKVAEIMRDFKPTGPSLLVDLALFLRQRYGLDATAASWPENALPPHLRPRVQILGADQTVVAAGRDLNHLRKALEKVVIAEKPKPGAEPPEWAAARRKWERFDVREWNFGDLPERLTITERGPLPIYAWPGLQLEDKHVSVRLFRSMESAKASTIAGYQRLMEKALERDLAWAEKDLKALGKWDTLIVTLCPADAFKEQALENLRSHILPRSAPPALTARGFECSAADARAALRGLPTELVRHLGEILQLRQEILVKAGPSPSPAKPQGKLNSLNDLKWLGGPAATATPPTRNPDLDELLPPDFLRRIPFDQLRHLPRYLKAMIVRMDRAALNPLKDQERARAVGPYVEALRKALSEPSLTGPARDALQQFRWMLEEFKVSLFAQELGTAQPVSIKRLDEQWRHIQSQHAVRR